MTRSLRIAASQFPVSGNLDRNLRYILKHIRMAANGGAHAIVFPETALSGYAPKHIPSFGAYDWAALDRATERVSAVAKEHNIWVMLGTMRQWQDLAIRNSVLVIANSGKCEATYDKRRIYGREVRYFSPGDRPCVFTIKGVRCGILVCYDNCFPELYAEYRDLGVQMIFHAFYNAGNSKATPIKDLMAANLIVRAADHQFWIVASNSSEPYSPLPASIVRPDGTASRAKRGRTELVVVDYKGGGLEWTYDNRLPAPAGLKTDTL